MVIRDLLKGVDNNGYDAARILWVVTVIAGIGYSGAHLIFNGVFSIIEFGTGMGGLLLLGAGGIAAKDMGVAKAKAQGEVSQP